MNKKLGLTRLLSPGLLLLVACTDAESALARGDALWADSSYDRAIAEYRLASSANSNDPAILARLAHAYAVTGEFDNANQYYAQLLERSEAHADQAVYDYMLLAERASERGDRFGVANAVDAALALRPGIQLGRTAFSLARYYAQTGDADRALDFYERALAEAPADSVAPLLFEMASVQESRGNCAEAIGAFNAFRARVPRGEQSEEARWHIGNCSFLLARSAVTEGRHADALRYLETVIRFGVPQNLVDQAWYEQGEILHAQGDTDRALESYYRVLELNPATRNQLTERARRRIDELRFGTPSGLPAPAAPGVRDSTPLPGVPTDSVRSQR